MFNKEKIALLEEKLDIHDLKIRELGYSKLSMRDEAESRHMRLAALETKLIAVIGLLESAGFEYKNEHYTPAAFVMKDEV